MDLATTKTCIVWRWRMQFYTTSYECVPMFREGRAVSVAVAIERTIPVHAAWQLLSLPAVRARRGRPAGLVPRARAHRERVA